MKRIKTLITVLVLLMLGSCKDFNALQLDPNRTTEATPGLLLTGIEVAAFNEINPSAALASRQLIFTDGVRNEQYYGWQRAGFDDYGNLGQVIKMEEEANRLGQENYLALVKFFKSWFIIKLTIAFGDVPYSEAVQGASGNFTPHYDTQENIYLKVLNDLKDANNFLSTDKWPISGDIIYNGNIDNWKKLINSFSLRILISLSSKEGNTVLNIKNRFKEITENPDTYPVFTSNADNAMLTYFDIKNNQYPFYNNNDFKTAYYMEGSFINLLKDRLDPRLFSFAGMTPNAISDGLEITDFNAYGGADGSAVIGDVVTKVVNGEVSPVNKRFYTDPVNEPGIALAYSEVNFSIAEAALRGWITGDPELYYNQGIEASMKFYGIDDAAIANYLQNDSVKFDVNRGLPMISTQRYLATFMNSDWEAFYNQRRTGYPVFSVSGGGILNNGLVPKRWMYPEAELTYNTANVEAAINRQFPAGDNINGVMWILVPE